MRLLVWGGGGHGKVVADLIRATGHSVSGFVDANPAKLRRVVEPGGATVVALEEDLDRAMGSGTLPNEAEAVAVAIGDNQARLRCAEQLGAFLSPPLVHPAATVSPSALLGDGTVVFAAAVVNAAARVGRAVIINTAAVVEHDCEVGDAAHVAPGVVLGGGVRVGEKAWIGAGATVLPMKNVGPEVIVGAGAVVLSDVPACTTVVGVPARPVPNSER